MTPNGNHGRPLNDRLGKQVVQTFEQVQATADRLDEIIRGFAEELVYRLREERARLIDQLGEEP